MIVGNEIHGLKVKHLHVGGVLGSGEVQNGIRGCIQVKIESIEFLMCIDGWCQGEAGVLAWEWTLFFFFFLSLFPLLCLSAGRPARCKA